jgi:hypothetical protein
MIWFNQRIQFIRNYCYIYYETKKYFFKFCFQDYPRLQPTDTFLNIGGIQIPKNNLAENKKALDEMSPVKNPETNLDSSTFSIAFNNYQHGQVQ